MKQLETLRLKLKRHKIQFLYNENLDQIEIGKSLNKYQRLLWAFALLSIGIVLFVVAIDFFLETGRRGISIKKLLIAIPLGLTYFGGMEVYKYFKLRKNNKRKIITPNSIIIQETEEIHIKREHIIDLDYFFDSANDTGESTGSLYLLTKGSKDKIIFLTLCDKDHVYLKNDLIFMKNSIKEYMNL